MNEAAPAPPRKPRGARWWPWVVVVALPLVAYVGGYAVARSGGTLRRRVWFLDYKHDPYPIMEWSIVADYPRRQATALRSIFRPCIAVEEWWLNR